MARQYSLAFAAFIAIGLAGFVAIGLAGLRVADVLQHHLNPSRDGLYVDPLITQAAAATTQLDTSFVVPLPGPTYAQPLYISNGPKGTPTLIAVTEQDDVLAISAADGSQIWATNLGTPVPRSSLPCGNIDPLGITGTPVIDSTSRAIYVSAMTTPDGGVTKQHLIYALSLDDGSTIQGWPVDVNSLGFGTFTFDSTVQNQRSGLTLAGGYLYVPYSGHFGDCGDFHGWVIAVPVNDPGSATTWATDARGGGIWAPSGLSTDGTSVFAATGNTFNPTTWMGGEAIVRLGPGATFSGDPHDYFAPSNWQVLDTFDMDMGGTGAILVDVPGATPSRLVVALGKNGVGYLLDPDNLGGIGTGDGINGEGLFSARVSSGIIRTSAAAFTAASGTYVVFSTAGVGFGCPDVPGNLVALRIAASDPPSFSVAWCAANNGMGAPIVTTTDGSSEPVVWALGSETTNRLFAYNGETGETLFNGGGPDDEMTFVRRWSTPIAANGRIYVAADNRLYAFTTQDAQNEQRRAAARK
jgi:hypothetical protein